MHVLGRKKGALIVALLAAIIGTASPSLLAAKPAPGYTPSGFRLFTRAAFRWVGNRTQCFLSSQGQICTSESSVTGGGYWPAGTNNQYIFNTGLQVAGKVDPASVGNPWAGDIEGAFFFNARGGGNGQQITEIYNSADPADAANWPDAAKVPAGSDQAAGLYDVALQGQNTASDNDIWFLAWEGDPSLSSGRGHPLGILVETRGLAYNTPGKNDMMFFIYTFYNVTASDPAAYNNSPARMQSFLRAAGQTFNSLNAAKGSVLPTAGYTITEMFLAIGTDNDVTFEDSGTNYDGVNVPMALGYTYHASFTAPGSWTFDPTIYKAPFFKGSGFVGMKYLKSPEINGVEVGLTLFGATTNGGQFSDPRNTQALYRYLTGTVDPAQGDDQCNVGDVTLTKICFINQGAAADMRFFQSSGPLTLAPGESSTIAVAYIFAPPVAVGACLGPDACGQVRPQNPTGSLLKLFSPDSLVNGVNTVDSITGYKGYLGDKGPAGGPADGLFNTYDLSVVPGSLLGKAQVAQEIFDTKFVQPSPPKAPNFFLIPADREVTIVWQPSITETTGDPFTSASDPNYRTFDVAGYRIYRGNRADQASLQLLAQFDKQGDTMIDVTGQVNTVDALGFTDCAPDLGVFTSCTSAGVNPGGVAITAPRTITLDGPVVQFVDIVPSGTRAFVSKADTAITGGGSGQPGLSGTGVPLIFVDRAGNCSSCGVNNGQNYFYMVSAFDINSVRSGPTSLESNLSGARRVVPQASPSNISASGNKAAVQVVGRNGPLAPGSVPTIDPVSGRFSGPFPPSNSVGIDLAAFLPSVLPASGAVTVTLDSIQLGDPANGGTMTYFWHSGTFPFTTTLAQDFTEPSVSASALYPAADLDPVLSAQYGGGAGYKVLGTLAQTTVGAYYAGIYGRGCVNGATGFVPDADQGGCDYNGPRWFMGPSPANNETKVDPIAGNGQNFAPGIVDNSPVVGGIPNGGFNNAGELTGVEVIHQVVGYNTVGNQWRNVEGIIAGAKRAADYNVYWSATTAGLIDSVIDVTHNVVVPFSTRMGASYGLLTAANAQPSGVGQAFDQRAELSLTDFGCVEPIRSITGGQGAATARCGGAANGDGPVYALSQQATIGNIVHFTGTPTDSRTSANTGTGFAIYMPGALFMFQTSTLPQGVVWSMRDYVGAITGGNGFGGNDGPYRFYGVQRPFSAAGASVQLSFTTSRTVAQATKRSLELVHTVPDPYYVTTSLEPSTDSKIIKFVNLPDRAIIRIYSASGVLVRVLEHNSPTNSELTWDVRNRNGQFVASGVYFYHIEALNARRIGRMTVVNFAK